MRSKKFRGSQCLSPAQILAKVKRQMSRQKQYQKMQENLLYLNNSFNNNIQLQQIFIDICKGKRKNIKSKELKTMYTLFSENKANMCIYQKIVNQELEKMKTEKQMSESSFAKWAKDTKGLMEIIQEEQTQTQKNIKTNSNLQSQKEQLSSDSLANQVHETSKKRSQRLSIKARNSLHEQLSEEREFYFLIRRIYCRLIEKILVKIAFYTMNNKFLDFLAINILDLTKNLETMIRRLSNIKDLRLLQQIALKVYRENLTIENKIYEMLVDGGYIVSIDQFYRVNGIDIAHKDVFQRTSESPQNDLKKKKKQTLKEKIQKIKDKKDKQNVVKKDHIDRTNNEINEKYLYCVSQIKDILEEDEDSQKMQLMRKSLQEKQTEEQSKKKINLSRTQPLNKKMSSFMTQKPSRFSSGIGIDSIIETKLQNIAKNDSQSEDSSKNLRDSIDVTRSRKSKRKTIVQYSSRISTFSPEFSKLIKDQSMGSKVHRNSVLLSEKFLQFNELDKGKRKHSKTHSQSDDSEIHRQKLLKNISKKKSSQIFSTFAINKLLKLYEARNTDRYSIDSFLGSNINLPHEMRQSLREQLLKLQYIYDSNSKRSSRKQQSSALQVYNFQQKKTHVQHSQSSTSPNKKFQQQGDEQDFTQRSQFTNQSNGENRKVHFSSADTKMKKHNSLKEDEQNEKCFIRNVMRDEKIIETQEDDGEELVEQENDDLIKGFGLVRLSKNRIKRLNSAERITPENNSIFTSIGVKNLRSNVIEEIPLKNQKLKRIPYIKAKDKFAEESQTVKDGKQISSLKDVNQSIQYPKILRKAYQSHHVEQSSQLTNQQKTVEEIVKKSFADEEYSLCKKQIYRRGSSLHKMFTFYENRISDIDQTSERTQKVDLFRTFQPRFSNNKTIHFSAQQNRNHFFREKKLRTTVHHSVSAPISPRNLQQKQNTPNSSLYEIIDMRKRRKLLK